MKIEIELPYCNLEKAFEKATEQAIKKIEDDLYEKDDYRSVTYLTVVHTGTVYNRHYDEYRCNYTFTFEANE